MTAGPGLEHVEALLALRGKTPARFLRNRLRLAICDALRAEPLTTGPEKIVRRVSEAHGIACGALYRSDYVQLHVMRKAGRVVHNARMWRRAERA